MIKSCREGAAALLLWREETQHCCSIGGAGERGRRPCNNMCSPQSIVPSAGSSADNGFGAGERENELTFAIGTTRSLRCTSTMGIAPSCGQVVRVTPLHGTT